ncbi:hypothetical protein LTR36_001158 [Oleoguttula mirabilis]|uniref:VOC domain-containing protein n=1 Tax=Oleoguttula mirabilis TaxID=1507867 RepID=A0AAV9J3Q5_9PEZI|nr:hypothetical protein LTR36_001158 [Oleoguttula mirabilis]
MVNDVLNPRGYMFPGGHCPDVGLGGFLLQGGMGWNCKNWGWACENIVGVDVVSADGEVLYCNDKQNEELFWMVRGAGPGFPAIVTRFHLRVRPVYRGMLQSFFAWPMSSYKEVINWVTAISPDFDPSTEIIAVAQVLPGQSEHSICALFLSFSDTLEAGKQALAPANKTRPDGCIIQEIDQTTSLADQYINQAGANPESHRYCADNAYVTNDADVASVLEAAFTTLPHKKSFALYFAMNPCSRRQLPDMALSMQSDHYFALYTVWDDAADDDRCQAWVRETMKDVERHSVGAYLGDSDFQIRRTRFWADSNAKRLMELRRKWDPEGRICGYLDIEDVSGVDGLANLHEWKTVSDKSTAAPPSEAEPQVNGTITNSSKAPPSDDASSFVPGKFYLNGHQTETPLGTEDPTAGYMLNHLMLRIRIPKASLHFYVDLMGMRTIFVLNTGPMTVYYLGYPTTPEHRADPVRFATDTQPVMGTTKGLLELVHVHGSEVEGKDYKYNGGNEPPSLGFGHLGFQVPDVKATVDRLAEHGVEVVKSVGSSSRQSAGLTEWEAERGVGVGDLQDKFRAVLEKIAFVKDPDGYYLELLPQDLGK